jgi:hypothetical protein
MKFENALKMKWFMGFLIANIWKEKKIKYMLPEFYIWFCSSAWHEENVFEQQNLSNMSLRKKPYKHEVFLVSQL